MFLEQCEERGAAGTAIEPQDDRVVDGVSQRGHEHIVQVLCLRCVDVPAVPVRGKSVDVRDTDHQVLDLRTLAKVGIQSQQS